MTDSPLNMNDHYDIVIVGAGPCGATAAALLGVAGLKVLICDKVQTIYPLPRAFALDHEIMRVFQQIGIAKAIEPFCAPFTASEFFGVDGRLIKRFASAEPPYPLGYVPALVFNQPELERLLRARLAQLPTVELALGLECVTTNQHDESVTVHLRATNNENSEPDASGSERKVRAKWLLACDGASSSLRSAHGIELEDLGFDQSWLVVDVLVNERGNAKLPKTSVQYCEPARPSTFLIGTGAHRRWEISLNPSDDPATAATERGTWQLLSRWITPDDATLWRQASYRFHALVAQRWRAGAVFLAGDAAHQQPPFLGQGMCQGIRDVANLCWKIAAVNDGRAASSLLESYQTERKAHVRELTTRIKNIGLLVGERDLQRARERDTRLLAECNGVVKSVPRHNVQPALAGGLLDSTGHPAIGTVFPQPWVQADDCSVQHLDEVAGCGWRLVLRQPLAEDDSQTLSEQLAELARRGPMVTLVSLGHYVETEGIVERWFEQQQCVAALVRPDHYVYGVTDSLPSSFALLARLKQQMQTGEFL